MNTFFLLAGILAIIVGLIHSVLGEVLIFKKLRNGSLIPTKGKPLLRERNVRILWASWHIGTIFGWALGAILLELSFSANSLPANSFLVGFIANSMLASSLLVLIATKAKHPGWVGLLGVAALCWMG